MESADWPDSADLPVLRLRRHGVVRPPKKPAVNKQHPAVNHVEKFLAEEFVVGAKGHTGISAFLRAYELWCAARDVKHRTMTPVSLLDYIERRHGVVARACHTGKGTHVFALARIQFRTVGLDARLKASRTRNGFGSVARAWRDIRGEGPSDDDDDKDLI